MTGVELRSSETAALNEAIGDLYAAFAPYGYRSAMPACAHCVSDEDLVALGRAPLRELPSPLLGRYTIKAVSTWGDVTDFKWLLPRLAELLAREQLAVPAGTLTTKLRRANWDTWAPVEHQAVRRFLLAWWRQGLAADAVAGTPVTVRLAAISTSDADLAPYLTAWHAGLAAGGSDDVPRRCAIAHLLDLVCGEVFQPDAPATVELLFWDPAGPAGVQTAAWLASPELALEIDRAIYDLAHEPVARRLTVTAARLRRFRAVVKAG